MRRWQIHLSVHEARAFRSERSATSDLTSRGEFVHVRRSVEVAFPCDMKYRALARRPAPAEEPSMRNFDRSRLSDAALLAASRQHDSEEYGAIAEQLADLGEIDARKLYLAAAYAT